jgi:hypothetical protein
MKIILTSLLTAVTMLISVASYALHTQKKLKWKIILTSLLTAVPVTMFWNIGRFLCLAYTCRSLLFDPSEHVEVSYLSQRGSRALSITFKFVKQVFDYLLDNRIFFLDGSLSQRQRFVCWRIVWGGCRGRRYWRTFSCWAHSVSVVLSSVLNYFFLFYLILLSTFWWNILH